MVQGRRSTTTLIYGGCKLSQSVPVSELDIATVAVAPLGHSLASWVERLAAIGMLYFTQRKQLVSTLEAVEVRRIYLSMIINVSMWQQSCETITVAIDVVRTWPTFTKFLFSTTAGERCSAVKEFGKPSS